MVAIVLQQVPAESLVHLLYVCVFIKLTFLFFSLMHQLLFCHHDYLYNVEVFLIHFNQSLPIFSTNSHQHIVCQHPTEIQI